MSKHLIELRSAQFKRSNTPGSIYFVVCDPMDAVKIGFTSGDPYQRLSGLRGACPAPLRLVAYFPGSLDEERRLHEAFAFLNIHREWFRLSGKLQQMIDYLCCDYPDPHTSRERFEDAVHDVLFVGFPHPDEKPESAAIYASTGRWEPFAHLLGMSE